jgi:hypothetical protein
VSFPARDGLAVVSALAVYRRAIVPQVQRQLEHWRGVEVAIG